MSNKTEKEAKGWCFFFDWVENLKNLTGDEFKAVVLEINNYAKTKQKPSVQGAIGAVISIIVSQMERKENISVKRANAGRKGANVTNSFASAKVDKHSAKVGYNNNNNNNNTNNNNNNNTLENQFDELWSIYPKKKSKAYAKKVYYKLAPSRELHEKMLAAVKSQKQDKQWQDAQYIPELSTWLNREKWNDEPTTQNKYCVNEEQDTTIFDLKF